MKVEIVNNDLIIVPETEFESSWLRSFNVEKTFHKTGLTPADYIGLKIIRERKIR